MYKYIGNYVNTNHVTQFLYPLPVPLYSSDLVVAFVCKAQNYCRKYCISIIQFVILAIAITFSCLTTIV